MHRCHLSRLTIRLTLGVSYAVVIISQPAHPKAQLSVDRFYGKSQCQFISRKPSAAAGGATARAQPRCKGISAGELMMLTGHTNTHTGQNPPTCQFISRTHNNAPRGQHLPTPAPHNNHRRWRKNRAARPTARDKRAQLPKQKAIHNLPSCASAAPPGSTYAVHHPVPMEAPGDRCCCR